MAPRSPPSRAARDSANSPRAVAAQSVPSPLFGFCSSPSSWLLRPRAPCRPGTPVASRLLTAALPPSWGRGPSIPRGLSSSASSCIGFVLCLFQPKAGLSRSCSLQGGLFCCEPLQSQPEAEVTARCCRRLRPQPDHRILGQGRGPRAGGARTESPSLRTDVTGSGAPPSVASLYHALGWLHVLRWDRQSPCWTGGGS